MSTLLHDLRYALRRMRRSPGFTLAAVLTLGLGMGANTAMFSLVEAILLRPLPYPEAERLVRVWAVNAQEGQTNANLNPLDLKDYRRQARSFTELAGISLRSFAVTGGTGEPERVRGALAGSGFFPALSAQTTLGRTVQAADEQPGAPAVAVLADSLWRRRFHGDPRVLGQSIVLDGKPAVIVGVLPAGFHPPAITDHGVDPPEVFAPLQIRESMGRGGHWLATLGRLAPGVPLERAQTEMTALAAAIRREHPETKGGWSVRLQGLREATAGSARLPLLLLSASVGLVLLIACANVANLLLMRAAARRPEIGVRLALGAGLPRLVRQLVTESLLLAVLGGAAGLVLAGVCLALFQRLGPDILPRQGEIGSSLFNLLSLPVLAFTAAVSLAAGLLFGLVPARPGADPRIVSGLGDRMGRLSPGRLPAVLAVGELALALVLLVAAGLLLASFGRLLAVDPGFRARGLLTMELELPAARAAEPARVSAFFQQLAERAAAVPGARGATAVDILPFGGGYSCNSFEAPEGAEPARVAAIPCAEYRTVVPGYFRTLGIEIRQGRDFTTADTAGTLPVAVVNETLARGLWPGRNPVGLRITLDFETAVPHTIIGVARDVHGFGLAVPAAPEVYVSHLQHPASGMTLLVRADRDPAALAGAVRGAVRELDWQLPVGRAVSMEDLIDGTIAEPRLRAILLALFAGLALTLAAVGIGGVIGSAVVRRRQEIGVRMALGADRAAILRMITGWTLLHTAAGLALGIGLSLAAGRLLAGLLFGVEAADPRIYLTGCTVLTVVAMIAGLLPAARASQLEPVEVLRAD
jgi:predicted permease